MLDDHKKTLGLLAVAGILLFVVFYVGLGTGQPFDLVALITGEASLTEPTTEGGLHKPRVTVDTNKKYFAVIKTEVGEITVRLFVRDATEAVNNFVYLAENDFYDGSEFHRIIRDFAIQSGKPADSEEEGPGYFLKEEINDHSIVRGTVAMAEDSSGKAGSQFFIVTEKAQPHLDGQYTVFGEVVDGLSIVSAISQVVVENDGTGEQSSPLAPVVIEDVVINVEE